MALETCFFVSDWNGKCNGYSVSPEISGNDPGSQLVRGLKPMVAKAIHFGVDDCYRVLVLQRAGYDLKQSPSLDALIIALQNERHVAAVFISEGERGSTERAADLVRRFSPAGVILFRYSQRTIDDGKFDRVYATLTPPQNWLPATAEFIRMSRSGQEEDGRGKRLFCDTMLAIQAANARFSTARA